MKIYENRFLELYKFNISYTPLFCDFTDNCKT